jgi:hypothetical protein
LSSYKFGFAVGEEYKALNRVELEFDEPMIKSAEFNLIKTVQPDPNVKKTQSGIGCFLTLSLLIAISVWFVFG